VWVPPQITAGAARPDTVSTTQDRAGVPHGPERRDERVRAGDPLDDPAAGCGRRMVTEGGVPGRRCVIG